MVSSKILKASFAKFMVMSVVWFNCFKLAVDDGLKKYKFESTASKDNTKMVNFIAKSKWGI